MKGKRCTLALCEPLLKRSPMNFASKAKQAVGINNTYPPNGRAARRNGALNGLSKPHIFGDEVQEWHTSGHASIRLMFF